MKKKDVIFWTLILMMIFMEICGEHQAAINCWIGAMLMHGLDSNTNCKDGQ